MPRQAGFTLVELMVTVVVAAIVLGFAVPSFQTTINASRLTGSANEMVNALQTARMEAIRRNQRVGMCLSANPNAAAPSCTAASPTGWLVFVDADHDGAYAGADTLLLRASAASAVRVTASRALGGRIVYRSDGLAWDATGGLLKGVIDFCIPTRQPPENARHLSIGSGSRLSIEDGTSAHCDPPADP